MTTQDPKSERTARTFEDRLFPATEWDSGWSLSVQADKAGYRCSPRERLGHLEDYDTAEAIIYAPFPGPVDPAALDLPEDIVSKFTPVEAHCPAIGSHLTKEDIRDLKDAISMAPMNPNAGIPRGEIGWAGREVWHGTSLAAAEDIAGHGVRMDASGRGYFGPGFYVADERTLAISNYADVFDEEPSGLVRATISDGARILDLRNPEDSRDWAPLADRVSRPDFDILARRAGIAGVYDRSMGGLAIYDAAALTAITVEDISPDEDTPSP